MNKRRAGIALAITGLGGLLALPGCKRAEAEPITVTESMNEVMEPMAEKIWAYASQAYNDLGDGFDAQKLSDADWKGLGEASAKLKARAQYFAEVERAIVAKPGQPILGSQAAGTKGKIGEKWDAVTAETVQRRIDADQAGFHAHARTLVDAANQINRAAAVKDAALFYKVSSELDEVCDGCHEPFWGTDEPPAFPKG